MSDAPLTRLRIHVETVPPTTDDKPVVIVDVDDAQDFVLGVNAGDGNPHSGTLANPWISPAVAGAMLDALRVQYVYRPHLQALAEAAMIKRAGG